MYDAAGALLMGNETYSFAAPHVLSDHNALHTMSKLQRPIAWDVGVDLLPIGPFGKAYVGAFSSFIFAMFVMIPFTLIPSTFITFVVREREYHATHLQKISGMHYAAYWLSNFLFDALSFLITSVLSIIIFLIFDRSEFVGTGETFGATFTLFMMFGLASVSMR